MTGLFVDNNDKWDRHKLGYHAKGWFAVLLSLAVLVGGGWFVYSKASEAWYQFRTTDDYIGEGTDPLVVLVPKGSSLTQIGDVLIDAGVVKSLKAWREAAGEHPEASSIQAGRYRLKKQLPASTAMTMLLDPANVVRVRVTLQEGLRMTQQWALIQKATGIPVAALAKLAADPRALGLPAWAGNRPEGFMFPDTYEVDVDPTAAEIMRAQVTQFTKVSGELNLVGGAARIKYTPLQVLTVASIIEKETSDPQYQPLVASVIYNRLAAKQKLELDSTVIYANNITGKLTTSEEQRKLASPYNTYVNEGLPPGPISNPGRSAMVAALNPASTDYLFFVATNPKTGETKFSKTFAEHQVFVKEFQTWCQANPGVC